MDLLDVVTTIYNEMSKIQQQHPELVREINSKNYTIKPTYNTKEIKEITKRRKKNKQARKSRKNNKK